VERQFEDTKGVIRSLFIEEEQSIQLQKENVKKKIQTMIYKTPENKRLSNNKNTV
jgi:hypothetical protein